MTETVWTFKIRSLTVSQVVHASLTATLSLCVAKPFSPFFSRQIHQTLSFPITPSRHTPPQNLTLSKPGPFFSTLWPVPPLSPAQSSPTGFATLSQSELVLNPSAPAPGSLSALTRIIWSISPHPSPPYPSSVGSFLKSPGGSLWLVRSPQSNPTSFQPCLLQSSLFHPLCFPWAEQWHNHTAHQLLCTRHLPSSSPGPLPAQHRPGASIQKGFLSFSFTAQFSLTSQGARNELPPSLLQWNLLPFQIQAHPIRTEFTVCV